MNVAFSYNGIIVFAYKGIPGNGKIALCLYCGFFLLLMAFLCISSSAQLFDSSLQWPNSVFPQKRGCLRLRFFSNLNQRVELRKGCRGKPLKAGRNHDKETGMIYIYILINNNHFVSFHPCIYQQIERIISYQTVFQIFVIPASIENLHFQIFAYHFSALPKLHLAMLRSLLCPCVK